MSDKPSLDEQIAYMNEWIAYHAGDPPYAARMKRDILESLRRHKLALEVAQALKTAWDADRSNSSLYFGGRVEHLLGVLLDGELPRETET